MNFANIPINARPKNLRDEDIIRTQVDNISRHLREVMGIALNVKINLGSIKDDKVRADLKTAIDKVAVEAKTRMEAVVKKVESGL